MTELRRLIDYPAIEELEHKSILKPELQAIAAAWDPDSGIEDARRKVFGVSLEEYIIAMRAAHADDEDDGDGADDEDDDGEDIEHEPSVWDALEPGQAVEVFARYGWDVTDKRGQPLRMLEHYAFLLCAAIEGDGPAKLPGAPLAKTEDWEAAMARDAKNFRPSRAGGK